MKKSKKPIEELTTQQESQEQSAADVQVIADTQPAADTQPIADTQTLEQQVDQPAAETQPTQSEEQASDDQSVADTQTVDTQTPAIDTSAAAQSDSDSSMAMDTQPSQEGVESGKKKKKKKERVATEGKKKEPKVGFYIVSLFKYFNIITLLPLALLMYAVFFSSYIVDKGALFEKNLIWICVIMGVAALVMLAWFIDTRKKRRVCSLDAFLLTALMICASMIIQCIIFKNFNKFDGIAIATVAATVLVLILMTVRLILFKPSEQRKNDDSKYTAKNKIGMYFKVIFAKYMFFIAMLCVIGALLILIISQSNIFDAFDVYATNLEKAVTIVFAAIAAVLMIVGLFIRIVRGRANVIDCMPYMFFIIGVGGVINFITRGIYMVLYVAIGSIVVGAVWLVLCQYTLLMSNYQKKVLADGEESSAVTDAQGADGAAEGAVADATAMETAVEATVAENTETAENTQATENAQVDTTANGAVVENAESNTATDGVTSSEASSHPAAEDNSTEAKPVDSQNE